MNFDLPNDLYSCEQSRLLDQLAAQQASLPGILLMKRAGRAALDYALHRWPQARSWVILCGSGNNAGDGYVFAALAAERHHRVQVFWLADPEHLAGDAQRAYQYARQEGVPVQRFTTAEAQAALDASGDAVIIDALLGIGLKGEVREPYAAAIGWLNGSGAKVLSLDLPSGLDGDCGMPLGATVQAGATITFVGCKTGLLTGKGPRYTGDLGFADLGIPAGVYEQVEPLAKRPDRERLFAALPERLADAHKGQFGYLLVVGGSPGFGGAAIMATETAAVTGVGLLGLATDPQHVTAALVRQPEVMAAGVTSGQSLEPLLHRPTAIAIGPGLGTSAWSEQLLDQVLQKDVPRVFDADALNLLASGYLKLPQTQPNWVLTPHPGEAARLLKCDVAEVERDRVAAVRKLHELYSGVILLKGLGTLVFDGSTLVVAKVGNPGLAHGGTGDVLTGLIGGLLAQGIAPFIAAQLAVCMHGDAADLAAEAYGVRGLSATQLIPYIRELLSQ